MRATRRVAQVDNVPDALMAAQQNAKANNCQSLGSEKPGSAPLADLRVSLKIEVLETWEKHREHPKLDGS